MKPFACEPLRLSIRSCPLHVPVVRAAIEKFCELLGFDAACTSGIGLGVNEALANIIEHAYGGKEDQPIEVELAPVGVKAPQGLRIRLRDYGRSVDPATIKSRPLDQVRPGGLGVHIMSQCMDELDYQRAEGGGTLLTLIKHIPQSEETNP